VGERFADRHAGPVGIVADVQRKDARVGDVQPLDAIDLEPGVDHGTDAAAARPVAGAAHPLDEQLAQRPATVAATEATLPESRRLEQGLEDLPGLVKSPLSTTCM
jgi:hypothetical protein